MPLLDSLLQVLPSSYTVQDRDLVERAYRRAEIAHKDQKRASDEPYIGHCVAVATILAELRLPAPAVAAGLLHDVVEDTPTTLEQLSKEFSPEVATMVDGVTKLTKKVQRAKTPSSDTAPEGESQEYRLTPEQAENIRKLFITLHNEPKVVLIKLADRLHNMRTLQHLKPHKQKRIAQETLDIMAPLANRLGIWQMKWELEDLSFRYLKPEEYRNIARQLDARQGERVRVMQSIIQRIEKLLAENNIPASVSGRPKHIYSIWKKMQRKDAVFEKIFDVRAVRVIVRNRDQSPPINKADSDQRERNAKADCYHVLGLVHALWRPVPNEFDDYIGNPKDNFYQSLHTAVYYDDGSPLEVQIRTEGMHEHAEYGVAAHWRYKEGDPKTDKVYSQRIEWFRSNMQWDLDEDIDPSGEEFVNALKSDLFPERVFVFTPRRDTIDLPMGSTPIDFAYHIHSSVGERCRGAKVNGKLVPLTYQLQPGDEVEVLTVKRGGPSRDWLEPDSNYVKSARARSKIKAYFRKLDHEINIQIGREIVDREVKRMNLEHYSLEELAKHMGYENINEMFLSVGVGELSGQAIVQKLVQFIKEEEKRKQADKTQDEEGQTSSVHNDFLQLPPSWSAAAPPADTREITVQGVSGLLKNIAKCCAPVPGEPIIGFVTKLGGGVTIHRRDCQQLLKISKSERLIDVHWGTEAKTYPVPIKVTAIDREGLLKDVAGVISNEKISMSGVNVPDIKKGDLAVIYATLQVTHLQQLNRILQKIASVSHVLDVHRVRT
ncbi:MAG TPA: bifunctional (p)ppGpp synthetase/guanosine-3',5'-bis(diphosphate) 3'-pyrophosphohydrolase [Anaerolineales bacterium]|nr:bifunctional (p)ppGpp synthetase/guanosine-3',5'-bis(diphosphate) 3'-pyrophosphohydrolase [Anaerolineales bacterium]